MVMVSWCLVAAWLSVVLSAPGGLQVNAYVSDFDEWSFRDKVGKALVQVEDILDRVRRAGSETKQNNAVHGIVSGSGGAEIRYQDDAERGETETVKGGTTVVPKVPSNLENKDSEEVGTKDSSKNVTATNYENPVVLAEFAEDHTYNDKFGLAESVTFLAISSFWTSLVHLATNVETTDTIADREAELMKWFQNHWNDRIVLKLDSTYECTLLRKEEKAVKVGGISSSENEQETVVGPDRRRVKETSKTKTSEHTITRQVTEYYWKIGASYSFRLVCTSCENDEAIILRQRKYTRTDVTESKYAPAYSAATPVSVEVPISWLRNEAMTIIPSDQQDLEGTTPDPAIRFRFSIDRNHSKCKTPRRNKDIDKALQFAFKIQNWSSQVFWFFYEWQSLVAREEWGRVEYITKSDMGKELFSPIIPLLENNTALSEAVSSLLLQEEQRSLERLRQRVQDQVPSSRGLQSEAQAASIVEHMEQAMNNFRDGINYIEDMLYKQMVKAIGKVVTPADFEAFMRFYNKKLFKKGFDPEPFSYAIRQPHQYPVGIVSLEDEGNGNDPVPTWTRHISSNGNNGTVNLKPILMSLDAATTVQITGDRYLSGWMQHKFEYLASQSKIVLAARARQFSSFLLLVGTMAGPDTFKPKNAIILQNKDEILIPLLTEVLPSAKAFKDAIASLSPEQQAFARAFRGMQLESSVFAVCVIQLKPQLEKLLGLPPNALAKEIKLTEDLMSLFVEYQIPSDLLSYDGPDRGTVTEKVATVKRYVKAVMDVIEAAQRGQLDEEWKKSQMRYAQHSTFGQTVGPTGVPTVMPTSSPTAAPTGGPTIGPTSSPTTAPSGGPSGGPTIEPTVSPTGAPTLTPTLGPTVLPTSGSTAEPTGESGTRQEMGKESTASSPTHQPHRAPLVDKSIDFTLLPKILDAKLEQLDTDGYLRSTIISTSPRWTRRRQQNLLTPVETSNVNSSTIDLEKKKAFDLLDAISRSGTLSIESSELHVIVAVTHYFEHSIMETLIKDNINPIEKVEFSSLLLASTIFGENVGNLIAGGDEALAKLAGTFPKLFEID